MRVFATACPPRHGGQAVAGRIFDRTSTSSVEPRNSPTFGRSEYMRVFATACPRWRGESSIGLRQAQSSEKPPTFGRSEYMRVFATANLRSEKLAYRGRVRGGAG